MSLLNYWPTSTEINRCINHEAEGAHDAVLLAVHQPTPLSYRLISSDQRREANEDELFNYLITSDVPSGAHVVPITGASGVGKSHMVRILSARLQSINDDQRYVIIRIPKSASLRRVVELILERLPGDEYADVKSEFAKALSEVSIDSAVVNFQGQLDIAFGDLEKSLRVQASSKPGDSTIREQYGHALALPKFMGDPVLVDYFRESVFKRIVQRAISGQDQAEQDIFVQDFLPEDFDLPDSIDISSAAKPTRSYYAQVLSIREGEGKRNVARLLNESKVVDQAIRQLFKLHESLGGMTLQDVILEIRRLLLAQGRELVILVEDFKALTGIQDTLLNVLIQEGVREGVRELATMRSVIAVTDGYLAGKDTIATRAKREWVVESHLSSDEEVIRRTTSLVSSYLNAARWGYDELLRHFERNGGGRSDDGAWIGPYMDHEDSGDLSVLSAFGKDGDVPLFPYTAMAIEQLARSTLTRNNALVFTPRFIIDNVLRAMLLPGRSAFERGQFPSPAIDAPRVNAEVTQWLASLPVSDELRERYRRVVAIWGNSPRSVSDVGRIPKEVFDAFRLESPKVDFIAPPPNRAPGSVDTPPSPTPPNTGTKADDSKLVAALENWVQKSDPLPQAIANQIRESIATALQDRIDWGAEHCTSASAVKSSLVSRRLISIPNAKGEAGLSDGAIQIAEDHSDATGQLRSELAAVVRFYSLNSKSMQYSGVDEDLVWIGNLVDRLMPKVIDSVRSSVRKRLAAAVGLLSINSRILGLIPLGRTPSSQASFLFGLPDIPERLPEGAGSDFVAWKELQDSARSIRSDLTEIVASYCGSFQGSLGGIAFAYDMVAVSECLLPEEVAPDTSVLDIVSDDLKKILPTMSMVRVQARAESARKAANDILNVLIEHLGHDFDKQAIADELKSLADQLKASGFWNESAIGMNHGAFIKLCEEFRSSAVCESLSSLSSVNGGGDSGGSDGKFISRMGRLDVYPLVVTYRFIGVAKTVIIASERCANMLEAQFRGVTPDAHAEEILTLFEQLGDSMDALGVEGESVCS